MNQSDIEEKYTKLSSRIDTVKVHFDFFSDESDGPNEKQMDLIRGMLLLCHAEFEAYIEDLAQMILDGAYEKWKNNHVANYNLSALFLNADKFTKDETVETKIGKIVSDHRKTIKDNNGIKEKNINKLFVPLGYQSGDFDSTLISDLNSFSTDRGGIAHTSAISITQLYDKQSEIDRINRIVIGMRNFQETLFARCN